MTCRNCKHDKFAVDEMDGSQFHWCKKYYDCYDYNRADECEAYEPKTNADKIRSMTDEELAEWLEYEGGGACAEVFGWLDWLKQPAEGEKNGSN